MRLATGPGRMWPVPGTAGRFPADGFCVLSGWLAGKEAAVAAAQAFGRPFRRILVGWDCSPGAAAALRAAAALATDDAVRVVALAVLRPAPHTEDAEEGAADFDGRQRFAQETFARTCEAMPGAVQQRVTLHFAESGDAARAVCEYAQQHGFDLLVLGRHGTGGVLHPRLGRVAATAARTSSLPLLLAP